MTESKTLRDTCKPRDEVLSGELRDEMFAANLSAVVRGQAHQVYQDPDLFFANTLPDRACAVVHARGRWTSLR